MNCPIDGQTINKLPTGPISSVVDSHNVGTDQWADSDDTLLTKFDSVWKKSSEQKGALCMFTCAYITSDCVDFAAPISHWLILRTPPNTL